MSQSTIFCDITPRRLQASLPPACSVYSTLKTEEICSSERSAEFQRIVLFITTAVSTSNSTMLHPFFLVILNRYLSENQQIRNYLFHFLQRETFSFQTFLLTLRSEDAEQRYSIFIQKALKIK
jgi:hypothetical protein